MLGVTDLQLRLDFSTGPVAANEARSLAPVTDDQSGGVPTNRAWWGGAFSDTYDAKRDRKQERRARRRDAREARGRAPSAKAVADRTARLADAQARIDARYAEARHRSQFTATPWQFIEFLAKTDDPDAKLLWHAECEPEWARLRRERHSQQNALVRLRLSVGYVSPGGLVGGNPAYKRPPFVHEGLVSEETLSSGSSWPVRHGPARLLTGDSKSRVERVGQKLLALDSPYVVTSGAMRRVLRVQLDRVFTGGFAELAGAVTGCGVPLPNIVVGYLDQAGQLLNPHLIWLLEDAVVFTEQGRKGPMALWRATLDALTAALLPIGADPGGRANAPPA